MKIKHDLTLKCTVEYLQKHLFFLTEIYLNIINLKV